MAGNTSDFNIALASSITKTLNNHRRNIMSNCNLIKKAYSSQTLNSWDGWSRANFHEKMFGTTDEGGIIGNILNACSIMNELLYSYAYYLSNVYNRNTGGKGRTYSPNDFVDSSIQIIPGSLDVRYASINKENVVLPNDFGSLRAALYSYMNEGIGDSVNYFNAQLQKLKTVAIVDETVSMIDKQTARLKDLYLQCSNAMRVLTEEIEKIRSEARTEVNKTVTSQQQITNSMGREIANPDGDKYY